MVDGEIKARLRKTKTPDRLSVFDGYSNLIGVLRRLSPGHGWEVEGEEGAYRKMEFALQHLFRKTQAENELQAFLMETRSSP